MEGETPKTLAELVLLDEQLCDQRAKLAEDHKRNLANLDARLVEVRTARRFHADGIDPTRVERGREVVRWDGDYENAGEDRASVLRDAKLAIAAGGGRLHSECFGTKDYDRWHGQRSDHTYGMGPRHGWIIFSIGLAPGVRHTELTPEQIEDALYVLENLPRIQAASVAAGGAA